ncbi:carbamoyl-phosphate synthase small subunit [bacterium]|nr:MAG: carbamoyl-phosphate synthase small subunit [bacterium]
MKALLLLESGQRYEGEGAGAEGLVTGEAVFFTGMTGYEEALTDPSYNAQILVFTYPMIGNYGISRSAMQHGTATAAGAVIKRLCRHPSHHQSKLDLDAWMKEQGMPAIVGIDTRALTMHLREHGTMRAVLAVGDAAIAQAPEALRAYCAAAPANLVAPVSIPAPMQRGTRGARKRLVLIDCGLKEGILQALGELDVSVTVLPWNATRAEILAQRPDAILISNGPGDPQDLPEMIATLRTFIGELPLFGICLGHQLLAWACGAKTFKLPYGHRGGNQPVKDLESGRVLVTAHNHGYAVERASLPAELVETMVNLNDDTNEGFRHRTLPIAAVQFHPEASPGPADARYLFERWLASV